MAYGGLKDLARKTGSDRVLRNEAFNIGKNPKYDGYQKGLASMVYKFFNKKSTSLEYKSPVGSGIKNDINLADMQLISKFEKVIRFLLCVIDIYSKYAWIITLKDTNCVSIVDTFQKILDDSKRK